MRRRRRPPGWVPTQHGAWAMLVLPLTVGAVRGGIAWVHLWLLVAWLLAYLAYQATALWLVSRRKPRYRPPMLTYAAATAVVGGGLLVAEPHLLRWGPVYAPLLAVSLVYAARRAERAMVNDVVTIGAASLMAVIAYGLAVDDDAWLPGAGSGAAWVLAGAVFAYLVGTAFYVKTMIRERDNVAMYRWSVAYHVAVALAFVAVPAVAAFLAVMAVKAAAVPRLLPRLKPGRLGIGELVASVVLTVVLAVVPL